MKVEGFEHKSSEKLRGELKAIQVVVGALLIILFFLCTLTVYGLVVEDDKSTYWALLIVAFSCSAIVPFQLIWIQKIKNELRRREYEV